MRFSAVVAALLAAAPSPSPTPAVPVYYGKPAAGFTADARPLGFDPDGYARWLVVARFLDSRGRPTRIMANSDLDWISRDGYVQWQTRLRFEQPSAILKTRKDGPLRMVVRSNLPLLGTVSVSTDTRAWSGPRVVSQALGPHAVQIGWFPTQTQQTRIVRIGARGAARTLAIVSGPSSNYRDLTVVPGARYRYVVYRAGRRPVRLPALEVPPSPPATRLSSVAGKGMWLYFTANPLDPIYFKRLNPQLIIRQAVGAGLRYVELRTAYGAYWEITPEAKPAIDAIVDGLAAHGIATIGWTVPRDATFEDLAASVRTAYYRTAQGTPLAGIALDLERGGDFMGGAPEGTAALGIYVRRLREALGPHYLIVSTIEDPYLERLTPRQYPYEQIARYSDVLQPMSYWRMLNPGAQDPQLVRSMLEASFETVRAYARRPVPISMGGQTANLGPGGAPTPQEITASLEASKTIGAIGVCFFAWDGTAPDQWDSLASFPWR